MTTNTHETSIYLIKSIMQTPPMLDYVHSDEILTKHKEAIRQLFKFAKIGLQQLEGY
jgi:hypothetical protein